MKYTNIVIKDLNKQQIIAYNIKFDNNFEVEILNLGGIITKIMTPDKDNNFENIVVGYKSIESYIENPSYFGAIIGRTSGRINEGNITIDNKEYKLAKNYNPHQGHGGDKGFSKKIWDVEVIENKEKVSLKLYTKSLDKEENYPGNIEVYVTYNIYRDYKIEIQYEAKSDENTLVNMTNHSYFNLSGDLKEPITNQHLKIDSSHILEIDETCVPTGKSVDVSKTAFDFRWIKPIGKDIDSNHYQINIGNGYDHPFILDNNKNIYMEDVKSKRSMSIKTDQKCVVVYSMNFTDDEVLYNNKTNQRRHGICFETQAPPIGRNMCFIDDSKLNKDETYTHKTTYEFKVQ